MTRVITGRTRFAENGYDSVRDEPSQWARIKGERSTDEVLPSRALRDALSSTVGTYSFPDTSAQAGILLQ